MKRVILFFLGIVLIIAAPYFIKQSMPFTPITGISMNPALKEGDLITYKETLPSGGEVGDMIIYSIPPQIQKHYSCPPVVTHRVIEIRNNAMGLYYRTKGDNNAAQDPWSVRQCDIIGKVNQRIPYLGFPLLFLQSRSGLILILITLLVSAVCLYADELSHCSQRLKMRLLRQLRMTSTAAIDNADVGEER